MPGQYLTEREVAEMTAIPVKTLRNLRWKKRLFPFVKINASVRYRIADIEGVMEQNKVIITK